MPSERRRTTTKKPEKEKKKKKKRGFLIPIPISISTLSSRCCRFGKAPSGAVNPQCDLACPSFRGFPTEKTPDYYFESAELSPLDNATSTSLSRFGPSQLQAVNHHLRDYDDDGREPATAVVSMVVSPCRKINNSVAMATDSEDPYSDFKRSMLQMVFEKEIRSRREMRELLNCFLQLNAPSHHDAIAQAYAEIWNDVVFSKKREARIGFVSCFT